MGHATYILDKINKKNNLGNDIINFCFRQNNEVDNNGKRLPFIQKHIRIFYIKPDSYNRVYTLEFTTDYEYLKAKITTYVDKREVVIYKTEPHRHLSENIFKDLKPESKLQKDILEAFNNIVFVEFFELKDKKFLPVINKNCSFLQTSPDGFYADDSIDNINPLELFSKIRTIADTNDEDRKKKLLLEVQKEFGIKS
jgi:hypothetical protein